MWVKGVWGLCVSSGLLVLVGCVGVCAWLVSRFVVGVCLLGVSGARGCLGAGVLLRVACCPRVLVRVVVSGGVGVSFDVGLWVFVLSGVSGSASGSASVSGSSPVGSLASECGGAGVSAPVGFVFFLGSGSVVPVLSGVGVSGFGSAPVGFVFFLGFLSGSAPVSGVSGGCVRVW